MAIELEVLCKECDRILEVSLERGHYDASVREGRQPHLRVEPCPYCLKDATTNGDAAGYQRAQEEAEES